ncbi:MAG: metallophosphoesterase [Abyssibacter sp.]|nr:metallophosphoesterase [Abyssibacter sp.]MCK5858020.1 metallophosphoesterase [Abyssibacter sp.]
MSAGILLVSDIHLKNANTLSQESLDKILRQFRKELAGSHYILLLIAGDIAYSGQDEEYTLANDLVRQIVETLSSAGVAKVDVLTVPGNHDCDFSKNDSVREIVLKNLTNDLSAFDESTLSVCTNIQNNYFAFADGVHTITPVSEDRLSQVYIAGSDGFRIGVVAINSSWSSKLKEQAGQILLPVDNLQTLPLEQACDLVIYVQHHPKHWLRPPDLHVLREKICTESALLITGHEHLGNTSLICSETDRRYVHIESIALVPDAGEEDKGATYLLFEPDAKQFKQRRIGFDGLIGNDIQIDMPANVDRSNGKFPLTKEFFEELRDAGGNFNTQSGNVALPDIFVYPDLETRDSSGDTIDNVSFNSVFNDKSLTRILLTGEEQSGKSSLIRMWFIKAREQGQFGVMIDAKRMGGGKPEQIERFIKKVCKEQYVAADDVLGEPKEKMIAFIDNLDDAIMPASLLPNLMKYLEARFEVIVASASTDFDYSDILNTHVQEALSDFERYQLKTFTHKKRFEMIKKWCVLDGVATRSEMDERVNRVETAMNSVIGKNLVPAYPIFVLILLQQLDTEHAANLQSSGFAHYYQFLITNGLLQAGLPRNELGEVENFLSNFAWLLANNAHRFCSRAEFDAFCAAYSTKFQTVSSEGRLNLLKRAKIVAESYEEIAFNYPYIFHFYIGRYLADNYSVPEAKRFVDDMCNGLKDRESAYALLFMLHHNRNEEVIEKVVSVLASCFSSSEPAKLEADVQGISSLVEKSSQMVIKNFDLDVAQEETRDEREQRDRAEDDAESLAKSESESTEVLREIFKMFRASEVLSQVLKNFYGNLERPVKAKLIRELIEAPMRMYSRALEVVGHQPELLASEIEKEMERNGFLDDSVRRKALSKKIAFYLLTMLAYSLIARTGRLIGIDKLQDDIDLFVKSEPTAANRLLGASARLERPATGNFQYVKDVANDMQDMPVDFSILQHMVATHIRQFHIPEERLQSLCAALDIQIGKGHQIAFSSKAKALKSKQ